MICIVLISGCIIAAGGKKHGQQAPENYPATKSASEKSEKDSDIRHGFTPGREGSRKRMKCKALFVIAMKIAISGGICGPDRDATGNTCGKPEKSSRDAVGPGNRAQPGETACAPGANA